MELREITPDELRARFAPPPDDSGRLPGPFIADTLRAQAHVLGPTLRRTLLRQACSTLAPLTDESELVLRVDGVLSELLGLGDLTGPLGRASTVVSPAPLRAVPLLAREEASVLLVGGPPTSWMKLHGELMEPGLRVARLPQAELDLLRGRVGELGGIVTTLDAWARRTHAVLDIAWLDRELGRLSTDAGPVPELEGIQVYDPARDRPNPNQRWQTTRHVVAGSHLVRGRDERGRLCSGVGVFSEGDLRGFARVTDEQACELRFGLDRRAGNPSTARFVAPATEGGLWTLEAPYLPRSEYRIVRALSFQLADGERGVRLDARDVHFVMGRLCDRLGLRCVRVNEPGAAP